MKLSGSASGSERVYLMSIDEQIEVLKAFRDGAKIEAVKVEVYANELNWQYCANPFWNFERYAYRVKREPWVGYVVVFPDGSSTLHNSELAAGLTADKEDGARWFEVREVK